MRGVLKSVIDHASRPYGKSAWSGKPHGVIGVSVEVIGTALTHLHLRNVLASLDTPTLCQPELFLQARDGLFDAEGELGVALRLLLQGWMDRYASWVTRHGAVSPACHMSLASLPPALRSECRSPHCRLERRDACASALASP
jgi:chromate reductase